MPVPLHAAIDLHFILLFLKTSAKLATEVMKHFSPLKHNCSFSSIQEKSCFSLMAEWSGFRTLRMDMSG